MRLAAPPRTLANYLPALTAATAAAAAAVAAGTPLGWLAPAAAAAVLFAALAPIPVVAAGWGCLLPVYGLAGVGPDWLDAARLLLAAALAVRVPASGGTRTDRRIVAPMVVLGCYMAVGAVFRPEDSPIGGLTLAAGVLVAAVVARRPQLTAVTVAGFAAGATCSAAVLLLQAADLPNPALAYMDNGRLPGLGSAAPRTSIEMAAACVVLFAAARTRGRTVRRRWPLAALLLCGAALACSGGRVGVAGLAAAALVGLRHRALRLRHVATACVTLYGLLRAAEHWQIPLLTVDRLTTPDPGGGDFASRRDDLFWLGLLGLLRQPLFGPGEAASVHHNGGIPHFAPLLFGIVAGVVGLGIGTYLFCKLAAVAFVRSPDGRTAVAAAVAAVFATAAALEPTGPFVGVGLVYLLLICVAQGDDGQPGKCPTRR